MDRSELARAADPGVFVPHLRDHPPAVPTGGHHHGSVITVRSDTYRGHDITVRTTYEVEVDGRPLRGHFGVGNDGRVHYHPLPNHNFESALELVRQVIDSFPESFPGPQTGPGDPGNEHSSGHGSGHHGAPAGGV